MNSMLYKYQHVVTPKIPLLLTYHFKGSILVHILCQCKERFASNIYMRTISINLRLFIIKYPAFFWWIIKDILMTISFALTAFYAFKWKVFYAYSYSHINKSLPIIYEFYSNSLRYCCYSYIFFVRPFLGLSEKTSGAVAVGLLRFRGILEETGWPALYLSPQFWCSLYR